MGEPVRIQRKRTKGWKMPPNTVYVGRPGAYGNRYVIGETIRHVNGLDVLVRDRAHAKQLYREWLEWQIANGYPPDLDAIRGMNQACWCPLDEPCHADVSLELANAPALSTDQAGEDGNG